MATTYYHGKGIYATADASPISNMRSWAVAATCGRATVLPAGGSWTVGKGGFKAATGTIVCLASGDYDLAIGSSIAFELWRVTGDQSKGSYTGNAYITGQTHGVDVNGEETVTYTFKFNGEMAYATS